MALTSLFNLEPHFDFGNKKDKAEENETAQAAPAPVTNSPVATAMLIDFDQLLMAGVVLAIVILASSVLVYAARH